MREIIKEGKTVDEAIELGCEELGLLRDDVSVEVLELPTKKLFGGKPAKVRIVSLVDGEDEVPAALAKEDVPVFEVKKEEPAKKEATPAPEPEQPKEKKVYAPVDDENIEKMLDYLKSIAACMDAEGMEYNVELKEDNIVNVIVEGERAGALIGRRGDTMDALQYLCSLVLTRAGGGDYRKVTLDVAGYRSKREQNLVSLAKRMADRAKKNGRNQTLEPMNPYERRIIHSAVQDIEGVKSESIGEDPYRRIVISPTGGARRYGGDRERRGGGHRDDRRRDDRRRDDRRPRSEATQQPEQPKEKISEMNDLPLFSKIEL